MLVRRGTVEPVAPFIERGLELTAVAGESPGHEGHEIGSVGIQTTSTPSVYFLAPVTGDASPASDDSASESERAEQSFRQTLFQLAPSLRDFWRTQIEWHALNFCHLDTPGYMASGRNYGLPPGYYGV